MSEFMPGYFMIHLPLLSILVFLPLVGAILVLMIQGAPSLVIRNARQAALWISGITFFLSISLIILFDFTNPHFQFVENHLWVPSQNIRYHLGIDGLSLVLILLTTFLIPICIVVTWGSVEKRVKECMAAFLMLESFTLGTFCALDFLLFYLFFEALLIPMFFIIGIWGGERRIYASFKFFLYTFLGSILMLMAILTIFFEIGTTDLPIIMSYHFDMEKQIWLWLAFFAAFAVKTPMWPFHTWLPDAHVEAPTAGSLILAGILLKMGAYGFMRICLPLFPEACVFFRPLIFALSLIAIIYASLVAWVQEDMKKLVAYSSIAHMGFVTLGVFTLTVEGMTGAIFQMLSHGIVSAGLFFCVGVLYDRLHTRQMASYGGVIQVMPLYGSLSLLLIMASVGLPGTCGFIGEFLVLLASYQTSPFLALGAGLSLILGALYSLGLFRRVMVGPLGEKVKALTDLSLREKWIALALGAPVLFFGIYPKPILNVLNVTVSGLVLNAEGLKPQVDEREEKILSETSAEENNGEEDSLEEVVATLPLLNSGDDRNDGKEEL